MVSKGGMSIRFATDTVPVMGKGAGGVKCMKLDEGDRVIFAAQIADEGEILTISDRATQSAAWSSITRYRAGTARA